MVTAPDNGSRARHRSTRLPGVLSRDLVGFSQLRPPGSLDILPTPSVTLMVQLGTPFRGTPTVFVAGLATSPTTATPSGPLRCVDVKLDPVGCRRLLGIPMHQITDRLVALEELVGQAAVRRLAETAAAGRGWSASLAAVEAFLVGRVQPADETDRTLAWCWQQLRSSGGRLTIESLAAEIGWSHRRLDRVFQDRVGVGPKMAARLIRLDHTMALLGGKTERSLADVALAAGFSDQAHMTNEMRALTARTPHQIRSRR